MSSKRSRFVAKLVRYVSTQGVIQLLGFFSGILVVRGLPKEQYAQYAVITAAVAALTIVSEGGVSSALFRRGSGHLNDPTRLSALFSGAMRYRRRVGLAVIVVGDAVLVILLAQNGADIPTTATYILVVTITFVPLLDKGISQTYLRLTDKISALQTIGLVSATIRALLICSVFLAGQTSVVALLLFTLAASFGEAIAMRRKAASELNFRAKIDREDTLHFSSNLRRTLPMSLLLVSQGQILYLMLSTFGSSDVVAEIAALSRFALVFVILNSVISDIGAGILARAPVERGAILGRMGTVLALYLGVAIVLVLLVFVLATQFLGLLGEGYQGLQTALVIVAIGSASINIGNAFRTLNQARGWLRWSWVFIPLSIAWATSGLLLNLTDPNQAAAFMALQAAPGLVTQIICAGSGLLSIPTQRQAD